MATKTKLSAFVPKISVRVQDLYENETIALTETEFSHVDISRVINGPSSAHIIFNNTNEQFFVSSKDNPTLSNLWDLLSNPGIDLSLSADKEDWYLARRPYINWTNKSVKDTWGEQFFKYIFHQPLMRELNADRVDLFNSLHNKVEQGIPPTEDELAEYFAINSYLALRCEVQIDIRDFNDNFWFPYFTGYVSSIGESFPTGGMATLAVSCYDWLMLWKKLMFPYERAILGYARAVSEDLWLAKQDVLTKFFTNALAGKNINSVIKNLVQSVDAAFTLEGAVDAFASTKEGSNATVNDSSRMKSPGSPFWTTNAKISVDEGQGSVSFFPVALREQKIWKGFIEDGPVTAPMVVDDPVKGVWKDRSSMVYIDEFLNNKNPGANIVAVIEKILKNQWSFYRDVCSHPFDIMTQVNSKVFGDFYCDGAGNFVYKLPRWNHIPSYQSSYVVNGGSVSASGVVDFPGDSIQAVDVYHGEEYILNKDGLKSINYFQTDEGMATKVKVQGGVQYLGTATSSDVIQRTMFDGHAASPPSMAAYFGISEITASQVFTQVGPDSLKVFAHAYLSVMNFKPFSFKAEYDRPLPLEVAKTVYIPNKDFLYYLSSINVDYTKGSNFRFTLNGNFGHPARVLLPIPWLRLRDGTIVSATSDLFPIAFDPQNAEMVKDSYKVVQTIYSSMMTTWNTYSVPFAPNSTYSSLSGTKGAINLAGSTSALKVAMGQVYTQYLTDPTVDNELVYQAFNKFLAHVMADNIVQHRQLLEAANLSQDFNVALGTTQNATPLVAVSTDTPSNKAVGTSSIKSNSSSIVQQMKKENKDLEAFCVFGQLPEADWKKTP